MTKKIDGVWKTEFDGVFLSLNEIESKISELEEAWQEVRYMEEEDDD